MAKRLVGTVTHYFTNIGVAVIEVSDSIKIGDEISIEGATTNFTQKVESIQIDKQPIQEAKNGDAIGLKVVNRVREGDKVYVVEE